MLIDTCIHFSITFQILADVRNPLIGESGAAAVYGLQKGLSANDVPLVDEALAHWALLLGGITRDELDDRAFLGAAGGVSLPLVLLKSATVRSGSDYFIELLNLEKRIEESDLVITGEGSFDIQSTMGKIVGWIVKRGSELGKPVFLVAGRTLSDSGLPNEQVFELSRIAGSLKLSIADPERFLEIAGREITESPLMKRLP